MMKIKNIKNCHLKHKITKNEEKVAMSAAWIPSDKFDSCFREFYFYDSSRDSDIKTVKTIQETKLLKWSRNMSWIRQLDD